MKKYKTLILLLILCMVVCIFAGTTYAWFVKVKRTGAVYFKTGEVEYAISDNGFKNNMISNQDVIIPGQELVLAGKTVSVTNKSSISSGLRVFVTVTVNGEKYTVTDDQTDYVVAMFDSGWQFNSVDGCWYMYDGENEKMFIKNDTADASYEIPLFTSLKLNGNKFGNSVSAKNVYVTIAFQGKQYDYAKWSELETIATTTVNLGD